MGVLNKPLDGSPGINPEKKQRDYLDLARVTKDRLMELMLAGESLTAAARILRMSYSKVRTMVMNGTFQDELGKLSHEALIHTQEAVKSSSVMIAERINEISELALDELEELVRNAKSEKVKLTAVQDALDRNPATSRKITSPIMEGFKIDAGLLLIAARTAREIDVTGNNNDNNTERVDASGDRQSRRTLRGIATEESE